VIERLLRAGGEVLLDRRAGRRELTRKRSQSDLVSDADRASEAAILDRLRDVAPDDAVLSEERGFVAGTSGRTWVVDPLDGTTNYAAGLDDFGVIIGLVEDSVPVAGGMFLPALDLLYLATAGGGATRNGQPVHGSTVDVLADAFVDHSLAALPGILDEQRRTLDLLIPEVRAVRCNHSLRYLAHVADGTYDAFVYHSLGLWDLVGSSVVLAEAGVEVTGLDGAPLDLAPTPEAGNRTYAAVGANPALRRRLVELLA
jgi:myo-inositol-1(or 4)-monophosphatase